MLLAIYGKSMTIYRAMLLFHYRCFSGQCIVKFTGRCMALRYAHFTYMHFVTQYQLSAAIKCLWINQLFDFLEIRLKSIGNQMFHLNRNDQRKFKMNCSRWSRSFGFLYRWMILIGSFLYGIQTKICIWYSMYPENNTFVIFLIFF